MTISTAAGKAPPVFSPQTPRALLFMALPWGHRSQAAANLCKLDGIAPQTGKMVSSLRSSTTATLQAEPWEATRERK